MAAHFDLVIGATEKMVFAGSIAPRQIAGAIEPAPLRMLNKAACRQGRIAAIAARDLRPADPHFACIPIRHSRTIGIEHVNLHVG